LYVKCSLDRLIERDTKGLYARALAGEIENFTGVNDPYEEPIDPEIVVETDLESIEESTVTILESLESLGYLTPVSDCAAAA
jgi:adenylylsulfate kinase-like enzyme